MKILYVSTISNTINAFLVPHIKMLLEQGHDVEICTNLVQPLSEDLVELNLKIHFINFNRNPLSFSNLKARCELKRIIEESNFDIIHTHTPVASAILRTIPNISSKIIYTAHGFHFFKGSSLLSWLTYYPLEKFLSKKTDVLITINQEDYQLATRKFKSKRVVYIHGVGINCKNLDAGKYDIDYLDFRKEHKLEQDDIILLSVGELNKNKNHQLVLRSLPNLDSRIHYFVCGIGPKSNNLNRLAQDLGVADRFHLLGYQKNIPSLLNLSDLFIFPSYREGLPVSIMEAMCIGTPIIASKIRGNVDLIENSVNGEIFDHKGSNVALIIKSLLNSEDKRTKYITNGKNKVQAFLLENVLEELSDIYQNVSMERGK